MSRDLFEFASKPSEKARKHAKNAIKLAIYFLK